MRKVQLIVALGFMVYTQNIIAQNQYTLDNTTVEVSPVIENLVVPWEIEWGPDDKLWVTHNYGTISSIDVSSGAKTDLVQVPDIYNDNLTDARMMGLAFHPDFGTSPYVYTNYTYKGALYTSRNWDKYVKIVRYTYDENQKRLVNPLVLLDGIKVYDGWHVGGKLLVGPDEKIYMSVGDAKQPSNPENHLDWSDGMTPKPLSTDWYSGKIIRLNLDGSVPTDNPFAELPYAPTPKNYTWSIGHRNTQGLVFGKNDILYYAEHGKNSDDEFGIIKKAGNYGWPEIEGFCDQQFETPYCQSASNLEFPLRSWPTSIAPSNMTYYDHDLIPEWKDCVLVASLTGTNREGEDIRVFQLSEDGTQIVNETILFDMDYLRIRDLAVSNEGELFFTSSNIVLNKGRSLGNDDIIFRVTPMINEPSDFSSLTLEQFSTSLGVNISWTMSVGQDPESFRIFRKQGTGNFEMIVSGSFTNGYSYTDQAVEEGKTYAYYVEATYVDDETRDSSTEEITVDEVVFSDFSTITSTKVESPPSIEIRWAMTNGVAADRYRIFRKRGNEDFQFLFSGSFNTGYSYTDQTVREGNIYTYYIEAIFPNSETIISSYEVVNFFAVALSTSKDQDSQYEVVPNPSNGMISIISPEDGMASLTVISLSGREVIKGLEVPLNKGFRLPLGLTGIYFIQVNGFTTRLYIVHD